jgi:fumarate reductase subunit C
MIMAYVRPVSKTTWYLKDRNYAIHMVNELTSIFIAIFCLILLWGIGAVARGPEAYESFIHSLRSPGMVWVMRITLIAMVYHAYAWFKVTPKAMPVQKGTEFVSGGIIAGAHFVVWGLLTVIVLLLPGVL